MLGTRMVSSQQTVVWPPSLSYVVSSIHSSLADVARLSLTRSRRWCSLGSILLLSPPRSCPCWSCNSVPQLVLNCFPWFETFPVPTRDIRQAIHSFLCHGSKMHSHKSHRHHCRLHLYRCGIIIVDGTFLNIRHRCRNVTAAGGIPSYVII